MLRYTYIAYLVYLCDKHYYYMTTIGHKSHKLFVLECENIFVV
jgi:hypothetical protein